MSSVRHADAHAEMTQDHQTPHPFKEPGEPRKALTEDAWQSPSPRDLGARWALNAAHFAALLLSALCKEVSILALARTMPAALCRSVHSRAAFASQANASNQSLNSRVLHVCTAGVANCHIFRSPAYTYACRRILNSCVYQRRTVITHCTIACLADLLQL